MRHAASDRSSGNRPRRRSGTLRGARCARLCCGPAADAASRAYPPRRAVDAPRRSRAPATERPCGKARVRVAAAAGCARSPPGVAKHLWRPGTPRPRTADPAGHPVPRHRWVAGSPRARPARRERVQQPHPAGPRRAARPRPQRLRGAGAPPGLPGRVRPPAPAGPDRRTDADLGRAGGGLVRPHLPDRPSRAGRGPGPLLARPCGAGRCPAVGRHRSAGQSGDGRRGRVGRGGVSRSGPGRVQERLVPGRGRRRGPGGRTARCGPLRVGDVHPRAADRGPRAPPSCARTTAGSTGSGTTPGGCCAPCARAAAGRRRRGAPAVPHGPVPPAGRGHPLGSGPAVCEQLP